MITAVEENYLKAIFKISTKNKLGAYTNDIAHELNVTAGTVSGTLQKIADKNLIIYKKYKPVNLTEKGKEIALKTIRKHRLWEVFLVEKLGFQWDEIHAIAEEMEHVNSEILIERLDKFLGNPLFDPHGDPIPNKFGVLTPIKSSKLIAFEVDEQVTIVGIDNDSASFLKHLNVLGLHLGSKVVIKEKVAFDSSLFVQLEKKSSIYISKEVAMNILCKHAE